MTEITIKQIEQVKSKISCSDKEAKEALEATGGDVLEAILLIEENNNKKSSNRFASTMDSIKGNVNKASKFAAKTVEDVSDSKAFKASKDIVIDAGDKVAEKFNKTKDDIKEKVQNRKNEKFKSLDELKPIVGVVNEANEALNDKTRTIVDSPISDILLGVLGAGVGGAISFMALTTLGVAGLSAAGITSGLAAAGAIVGGGMVAGIFVLSVPVTILAGTALYIADRKRRTQLKHEKERLLRGAVEKQNAIAIELNKEVEVAKERIDYLNALNILLQGAVADLQSDLRLTDDEDDIDEE